MGHATVLSLDPKAQDDLQVGQICYMICSAGMQRQAWVRSLGHSVTEFCKTESARDFNLRQEFARL
jgi:sorbitol-specific phosphotransferase system component IIA